MGANKWFKFYGGEYLSDPKIESLTLSERSCWITLMCLASMNSTDGLIEFLTVETLLNKSGIVFDPFHPEEWDKSLSVLKKLERMRMVILHKNGDIEIINWSKRQETNLTDAERAKSYRDRKRVVTQSSQNKVTNVTQEEKRIDKNRIEHRTESVGISKKEESYSEDFEKFWLEYPEKKGKGKAYESWLKIKGDKSKIIEAIKKQVASNHFKGNDGKQYIPNPATWLNQKRWEDEIKTKQIINLDFRTK